MCQWFGKVFGEQKRPRPIKELDQYGNVLLACMVVECIEASTRAGSLLDVVLFRQILVMLRPERPFVTWKKQQSLILGVLYAHVDKGNSWWFFNMISCWEKNLQMKYWSHSCIRIQKVSCNAEEPSLVIAYSKDSIKQAHSWLYGVVGNMHVLLGFKGLLLLPQLVPNYNRQGDLKEMFPIFSFPSTSLHVFVIGCH